MITAKISASSHLPFRGDRYLLISKKEKVIITNVLFSELDHIVDPEFVLLACYTTAHRPAHFSPQCALL